MLKINNLNKSYADKKAVDNLCLEVKKGEIFGFIGPNGAGKTTTIKMIVGILKKDSGEILVNSLDNETRSIEVKRNIAYVPDNPDIQRKLKGIEYINFLADLYDISKEDRLKTTNYLADLFEMKYALNDQIGSYSHGMQQKIVLMGALVTNPDLIILDEPMVGLDPKSAFNLKNLMKDLCKEGKTVFFSTHVLDVAEKFCDRVGIIAKGKLIASGTIDELRTQEGSNGSLEEIFLEITGENYEK